ncbi:MAG: pseudouridine synthase [Syntrophales bacterium]
MKERLHKIMAAAGIASRRAAEEMIRQGRVSVNNAIIKEMGVKADPAEDEIRVDGKLISIEIQKIYLMLNKPPGYVTTLRDPEGRRIITDLLRDISERVYPVGRLDYDSEGLILLTNDGDFAQKVQHPRFNVPKTYLVKIKGNLSKKEILAIQKGIDLEDGRFSPLEIEVERINRKSCWVRMVIHEGRNRVIRRLFEAMGHPVTRLVRVAIGELSLGSLKVGEFRYLKRKEIHKLMEKTGVNLS